MQDFQLTLESAGDKYNIFSGDYDICRDEVMEDDDLACDNDNSTNSITISCTNDIIIFNSYFEYFYNIYTRDDKMVLTFLRDYDHISTEYEDQEGNVLSTDKLQLMIDSYTRRIYNQIEDGKEVLSTIITNILIELYERLINIIKNHPLNQELLDSLCIIPINKSAVSIC